MTDSTEKIEAGIATVECERVRWLLGKKMLITTEGNVFGSVINEKRYTVVLNNAAHDELERNLVLSHLKTGPKSVMELSELSGIPKGTVVNHIIALRKWRRIEDAGNRGQSPLYKLTIS
jgi:hypothetical protein